MAGPSYKHVSKPSAAMPSLRQCEREYFRQHRFIGLPHGVVAAGPAGLAVSVAWRLSLDLASLVTWSLPIVAFCISYLILCRTMPSRDELRARAVCDLLERLTEFAEQEEHGSPQKPRPEHGEPDRTALPR